jgi:hypothetical protein
LTIGQIFWTGGLKPISLSLLNYKFAYWIFIVLLIIFETYFLSYFGGLLLPKEMRSGLSYFIIGFILANFFAFSLHFAFEAIFRWYNARHLIRKALEEQHAESAAPDQMADPGRRITKRDIAPFRFKFALGVVVCALFLLVNIAAGFVRAYLLDPTANMQNTSLKGKLDLPWHIFAIVFPISLALVMALAEMRLSEIRVKLSVHQSLKRQQKELLRYHTSLNEMLDECKKYIGLEAEKYWSTMKDLQRIFNKECDEKNAELLTQLRGQLADGSLGTVDEKTYAKYSSVSGTYQPLFFFPIDKDPDIVAELEDLAAKKSEVATIAQLIGLNARTEVSPDPAGEGGAPPPESTAS